MYLWTYGLNLLYSVCFFLLPLIACFCSRGLLSCSQIRWGDLSKCCRVLQLWECHLITRAHCVTSCCLLEEAWVSVCSLNSIDCRLQNLNRFQSPVPQPVAPLFFFSRFVPTPPPKHLLRRGLAQSKQMRAYFPNPENLNALTWGVFCFLHFVLSACRTAAILNEL